MFHRNQGVGSETNKKRELIKNMPVETTEAKITQGEAASPAQPTKKIFIDLEGRANQTDYPKPPLIPEDSYDATFVGAELGEFPGFDDPKVLVSKFVFQLRLENYEFEGKEVVLPFFVKAVVTKAYKPGVSNSTLYDLIESAGLMDSLHKNWVEFEDPVKFRGFIEGNLLGRSCRVQVGTVNKKNPDKEKYSKVEKVLRFVLAKPEVK